MWGNFDDMIFTLLSKMKRKQQENEAKGTLDEAEINYLYRRIVDKVVICMFDETIDNEDLQIGFMSIERMHITLKQHLPTQTIFSNSY